MSYESSRERSEEVLAPETAEQQPHHRPSEDLWCGRSRNSLLWPDLDFTDYLQLTGVHRHRWKSLHSRRHS